jgi:fluoride exporter
MKFDRREIAAVFVGGIVGTLARVGIAQAWPAADDAFPWAIFIVNISGTFLLGWLVTRLQERLPLSTYRRQLMGTGFCGAYTTFSTMQLELLHMFDAHRYGLAVIYAVVSVVCGYIAIYTATAVSRRVRITA